MTRNQAAAEECKAAEEEDAGAVSDDTDSSGLVTDASVSPVTVESV